MQIGEGPQLAAALARAEKNHPQAVDLGLARVDAVRREMGLSLKMPIVTVGGTNGKGSVCAMLEAILSSAGYKVGCFTSPHLLRFNERIRVGENPLDDQPICDALAHAEFAQKKIGATLTFFEFAALAAAECFVREKADAAILEVGLGGRLDAVNIFSPTISIVTTIDLDHAAYLGNDRESVGGEKAGIFRPNRPAIIAEKNPPNSLLDYAKKIGAKIIRFGEDFDWEKQGAHWNFRGQKGVRSGLPFPSLRGMHQLQNAAAAIAAAESLADESSLWVSAGDIRSGLLRTELAGRFQSLPGQPAIVLDVAHNPQAASAFAESLFQMGFFPQTVGVCGLMADKDCDGIIRPLLPRIDKWLAIPLDIPRALPARKLAEIIRAQGGDAEACESTAEAFSRAHAMCDKRDRIAAFGSFHTIAAFWTESDEQFRR